MRTGEIFISTARAARNMSYQGILKEDDKLSVLIELIGQDIMGMPLKVQQWDI